MSGGLLWDLLMRGQITTSMYEMLIKMEQQKTNVDENNCPNYIGSGLSNSTPVR